MGFEPLECFRGWLTDRADGFVATVLFSLAVALGLFASSVFSPEGGVAFAQGANSAFIAAPNNIPTTVVPAIPELTPSSNEAEAIFKLASRLEAGDTNVPRDEVLARRLYRIAADAGHAGAQCNLGAMLMDGTGGPTDLAGGASLFRKAALRGHGLAQYNLGVMHALGDGVIKDSGEAMAWIEQAITRLPEGEAITSAKAWREHLRNRMSSREGLIARNRSQELGEAIIRELAAASTGSASRAARTAVRAGLDQLGLSPEALQRLGIAPSGAAWAGGNHALTPDGHAVVSRVPDNPGFQALPGAVKVYSDIPPTVPVQVALQDWLKAWSDRRADDYLKFYDPSYAPLGGVNRADWARKRRSAIRYPKWVKVRAEDLTATEISPEEFVLTFVQVYSASTGHREDNRKSMIWRWADGKWRIVSEQSTSSSTLTSARGRKATIAAKAQGQTEAAAAVAPEEQKQLARGSLSGDPAPSPVLNPVPAVSSVASAPDLAKFEPAVRAWIKAWGDRQVGDYLAFYSPAFELPAGQDRDAWEAERRQSMTRPAWIKVRADQLKTSVVGGGAEARFFQVYVVAPGTVELLRKTMKWVWADARWQIIQEQSEPMPHRRSVK